MTIEQCINQYHYKPLPPDVSAKQRKLYFKELPPEWDIHGNLNCEIYDTYYNPVAHGYSRIVIGDYGAYVEIPIEKMILDNIIIKPGEEYRFKPEYKNVKYHWYCLQQNHYLKIYYQKNRVAYADYKPEMFYISPYELRLVGGKSYE